LPVEAITLNWEEDGVGRAQPLAAERMRYHELRLLSSDALSLALDRSDPLLVDIAVARAIRESARELGEFDRPTVDHQWRTAELSGGIGARLQLPKRRLHLLVTAATLHDVGKLFVPQGLLHRPGPLTADEYERVRDHSARGAEWLQRRRLPAPIPEIVRWHHERWDGRGYPDRLAGEEIPLESRVLALADATDAMLSQRPYHRGRTLEEVRRILVEESGRAFDPQVVEAALSFWD